MMNHVAELLAQGGTMSPIWIFLVWTFAAYLLALGAIALCAPGLARGFLQAFARTPLINSLEAGLRLIAGVAFMGASPETRLPALFFWFGAFLAASALLIALLYPLHRRYAEWTVPFAVSNARLIGVFSLALCGFIVWAML